LTHDSSGFSDGSGPRGTRRSPPQRNSLTVGMDAFASRRPAMIGCTYGRLFGSGTSGGTFSMAFFTDFTPYGYVGLLDWYTLSVALFATIVLAAHGATYLTLKTEGAVHDRSASYARVLWTAAGPLLLAISVESEFVRPDLLGRGAGVGVLLGALHCMRAAGGQRAQIAWVGPVVPYARVGAVVSKVFFVYRKKLR
jgi:cytochrome bd-type quinol oxidase subunit 2